MGELVKYVREILRTAINLINMLWSIWFALYQREKKTYVESPNFDVLYVNAYTVCIMHFIIVYSEKKKKFRKKNIWSICIHLATLK